MDILDAAAIELACGACGGRYEVSLKQILLSERMMHQGRPVPSQYTTECPPQYYADLVDRELIQVLQRTWLCLEERAQAAGGRLLLRGRLLDGSPTPQFYEVVAG
jgi:hypothetical protein